MRYECIALPAELSWRWCCIVIGGDKFSRSPHTKQKEYIRKMTFFQVLRGLRPSTLNNHSLSATIQALWNHPSTRSTRFVTNSCACRTIFDFAQKARKIADLTSQSEQALFWDDPKRAGSVMKELERLKGERDKIAALEKEIADLTDLVSLGLSDAETAEVTAALTRIEKSLADWEFLALLSGEYDARDVLLTIHSGAGGSDAQDWAEMLLRMYLRFAEQRGWKAKLLDESRGAEAGIKSATIEISGEYAYGYLLLEAGIHRLVRLSPFNANSLRQTSFASVEIMPVIEDDVTLAIRTEDLRIDTYRSSGAGGQNVNKTESAVRITHIPSGLVAACQSERSQLQNREEAMKMLRGKLAQQHIEAQALERQKLKGEVKSAAFSNQIRSYVLHPYTLVKDHRSNVETSDVNGVLEGRIDLFIESNLRTLRK